MPRRLLGSQALQQTEHDRLAVPLRQLAHLFVDHCSDLITITAFKRPRRHLSRTQLMLPAPGRGRPGAGRGAIGDLMKPGPQRVPYPKRAGPAQQNQERGLKGIVSVVSVAEHGAADTEHHRPVALDQYPERQLPGLIPLGREPLEQLRIRQSADHSHAE